MTSLILYSLSIILLIISFIKNKDKSKKALVIAFKSFEGIMPKFLGIIIIVGIILSVLNPETISKLIGESSGIIGIIVSDIIGSITLIPTFVGFSLGNTLLENGAGYGQVGALISSLSLVGILTLSLEAKHLGTKATFLRNLIGFLFSIIVGIILGKVMVSI